MLGRTGVEAQLARLSAKLTLGDVGGAQTILTPIQFLIPTIPRYFSLRTDRSSKETHRLQPISTYSTRTESQDARGFAYFGRLFLDQRDYPKADALSAAAMGAMRMILLLSHCVVRF